MVEEKKANLVMAIMKQLSEEKKLTRWSQSDCEKGKLNFGDCRMVGEKKANLVLMISWLEKESSPNGHNEKTGEEKDHLVVTIRWLEKRKLTWWSQSDGWRRESSPGGHNQMAGEEKAHLVVTITW